MAGQTVTRECAICREDMDNNEYIGRGETCFHYFCFSCLSTWRNLQDRGALATTQCCPTCKMWSKNIVFEKRVEFEEQIRLAREGGYYHLGPQHIPPPLLPPSSSVSLSSHIVIVYDKIHVSI